MPRSPSSALLTQCSERLGQRDPRLNFQSAEDRNQFLDRVARRVAANTSRYPARHKAPRDPVTGVPDIYIDRVITYTASELPWYEALRNEESAALEALWYLIYQRVRGHRWLRINHRDGDVFLIDDLTMVCAQAIRMRLTAYYFDCPLEAWVSTFVTNEVSNIVKRASFRHNENAWRLDEMVYNPPASGIDGGSDPATSQIMLEFRIDLLSLIDCLSPREREVVEGMLRGDSPADIALDLGINRSTVYTIRDNAYERLRSLMRVGC